MKVTYKQRYDELAKRILYSNFFCRWRDKTPKRIICRHPFSYWICDLDLCPIYQQYFANIVFLQDGVYLVIKRPGEFIAGEWKRIPLEFDIEKTDELRKQIEDMIKDININDKMKKWLFMKFDHIVARWKFLIEHGIRVPYLEQIKAKERKEEEIEVEKFEEEKEAVEKEIEEIVRKAEEKKPEEKVEEEEEIERLAKELEQLEKES